jgi:hypothetical protein
MGLLCLNNPLHRNESLSSLYLELHLKFFGKRPYMYVR